MFRRMKTGVLLLCGALAVLLTPHEAPAQVGGILIDAEGVVSAAPNRRESDSLARRRREAFAEEHLSPGLSSFTEVRHVSLRQIESQLEGRASWDEIPMDVRYLYGLQRIDYVFLDVEQGDVVLAGPAEGFAPDPSGRILGGTTGRPPIRLDDLAAALRWGEEEGRGPIRCSIDFEQERLARMLDYIRRNSTPARRDAAQARYGEMARILGPQPVTVEGVPPDSHFARVIVEADVHLKLIALGKQNPRVRGLVSQLSLLTVNGNTMQRWWFLPLYDPISVDDAGLSFGLSGQRLQVMAQEEWSDSGGNRRDAPTTRATTEKFAQAFTEHVPELVEQAPAFAELQNVFDLAVLAALLRREEFSQRSGWNMEGLRNAPGESLPVPRTVPSGAATVNRSRFVLGLVGGVVVDPGPLVRAPKNRERSAELTNRRSTALTSKSAASTGGWWDSAATSTP